jgi:hypothetical protein
MPTIVGHHDISKGKDHWLSSPKREELFGPLGVTNIKVTRGVAVVGVEARRGQPRYTPWSDSKEEADPSDDLYVANVTRPSSLISTFVCAPNLSRAADPARHPTGRS